MKNKKNIIIFQADDYFSRAVFRNVSPETFMNYIRRNTIRYTTIADKIVFMERIALKIKQTYDQHALHCSQQEDGSCRFIKRYERVLFYIQSDLVKMKKWLSKRELNEMENRRMNVRLKQIIDLLNQTKVGKKINYKVFMREIGELKSYYYLNKKLWRQLLVGKITQMISQGTVKKSFYKEVLITADMVYYEIVMTKTDP